MLWVLTIWSYSVSMTGAACWNRKRFSSRASVSATWPGLEKSGSELAVMPYAWDRWCDCTIRSGPASAEAAGGAGSAPFPMGRVYMAALMSSPGSEGSPPQ
ncbi:hypothetical protein D9M69_660030 [compost metagenome]